MIDAGMRDVTARVQQILAASPLAELRNIQVEQHGNRFFLRGKVRTFYAKQMAQEAVRCAVRGLRLVNNVSVD
ncbi:MAG: BON domain-containing protein [Pirellulaceae bacterium]|nr:BON domain-containing protein [Pirellulaceae bacterium]